MRPLTLTHYRYSKPTSTEITIDALSFKSIDVKQFETIGGHRFYFDLSYKVDSQQEEKDKALPFGLRGGHIYGQKFCSLQEATNDAMRVLDALYIARNAPIEVTKKVLDAMAEVHEAKFWVGDDETKYKLERPCNTYVSLNDEWTNGRDFDDEGIPCESKLQIGDYIQADCPLALQVLLGFTTEGVPVNE
jgi:hypothetical protein